MSAFLRSLKPTVSSTVMLPAVKRILYSAPGVPSTVRPEKVTIPPDDVAVPPERITPPVDSNRLAVTTVELSEVARFPYLSSYLMAGCVFKGVLVMLPTGFVVRDNTAGSAWARTSSSDGSLV